jgi:hypothetical protein
MSAGMPASQRSRRVKALASMGGKLVRQRLAILIVLSLAVLGGICGWFLRDQIVHRGNEMLRESTYQQDS